MKTIQPLYPEPMKKAEWQTVLDAAVNCQFSKDTPAKKVVLLVEDASRPSDTAPVIEFIIPLLKRYLPNAEFSLIIAGGAHQGLEKRNTRKIPTTFPGRVSTHHCTQTLHVGDVDGVPLWLNREVVEADFRIAVGTVNLHPIAGFSGGAKIITPGVAGLPTIFGLHNLDPGEAGQLETPIRRFANHVLDRFPVEFSVQLLTNSSGAILEIVTGELYQAWRSAVELLIPWVVLPFPGAFPTCLAETNPFDRNLLGIFKALPTVLSVLEPGGIGYLSSPAPDGLGLHLWRLDPSIIDKERELLEKKIGNRQIRIITVADISYAKWKQIFPDQVRRVKSVDSMESDMISIVCAPLVHFS